MNFGNWIGGEGNVRSCRIRVVYIFIDIRTILSIDVLTWIIIHTRMFGDFRSSRLIPLAGIILPAMPD